MYYPQFLLFFAEVRACNIKLRRYLPSRAVKNKVTSGVIVKQRRHERVDSEWTIKKRVPQYGKPLSNGPQDRKPVPRSNGEFTIATLYFQESNKCSWKFEECEEFF